MGQWGTLIPLILMFVVFYFLLIRPQQKRQKERMAMLNALKKGDKVITIGGIHGTIVDLTEDRVTLKVSDNTRLVFERSSVNSVVTDEDASAEKEEKKKEEKKEQAKEESK
ncbi:preprotein translocase subunit YajC [Thermoactinomyces intermedius]|jgi:preprotein translocase subunit YajC|uniref:Preprotein translocase subunit YajC n=1 Tax=Thermoactinomyces intermedius TaxID=2024 RepID=A0A8I1AEC4_THEIN|nr:MULTISPECIES: preprotein translocase subunit YajC [Thermoactinomyces]MBA4548620.1 preprotein translocase subunit YajC [Thermoactinomyces intermedius]MBA4836694.1 preprotein translocase subunit YajC [Thermoactinomyces intermedius]MBH8594498.1 preprotein translocase subunit YajC [Thermoactinomyces intermedius]MBH8601598.1 preprotein translocase subunit YajC [Thermoactinomyces sp. CICC 23799]